MASFSFRAQAFSLKDTQVSVDADALTLTRPNRAAERYPLSAIQTGNLMVADDPATPGQTGYLKLVVAGRGPLWINSTSPSAPDGGMAGFLDFVAALKAALIASGRQEVIVRGSPGLAWLGAAFVAVAGLLSLVMLFFVTMAIVQGHPADAAAPGLFLLIVLVLVPVGWRSWRANRGGYR
jgi:hypothetical protein